MNITVHNKTKDFKTYRASRVKSLFNPERGNEFKLEAKFDLPQDWSLGLVVGASGTGKTSIGKLFFENTSITDLYDGWDTNLPIVDNIGPDSDFDTVTGSLAAVGLGDVPSWLRPFNALSNGQQFRAGLARVMCGSESEVIIDEFTSVVDRQIAKIGAMAFAKSWRRQKGRKCVLISCHYDIVDWLEPDWVFNTDTGEFIEKKTLLGNDPNLTSKLGRSAELTGTILSHITI